MYSCDLLEESGGEIFWVGGEWNLIRHNCVFCMSRDCLVHAMPRFPPLRLCRTFCPALPLYPGMNLPDLLHGSDVSHGRDGREMRGQMFTQSSGRRCASITAAQALCSTASPMTIVSLCALLSCLSPRHEVREMVCL